MIIDQITNSARIEVLHPQLKKLFDYVRTHDLLAMPVGRITLDGDRLFINRAASELLPADRQAIEVHRAYMDVHFPLDGVEVIGWKPLDRLGTPRAPFDTDNDFALYDEPATTYFELHPGQFLLVYPEDGHAPIIGTGTLQKAVAKVLL